MFTLPKGRYSKNFLEFFDWSCGKAKKFDKIIDVRPSKYLYESGRCRGFCDGDRIVVAGKAEDFELTYTHEFSHLEQALEQSPVWHDIIWPKKYSILDFEDLYRILLLERDCEIRSVKHSKKWNLFDEADYIKKANCYLYLYHFIFLKKKWVFFKGLYGQKELLAAMPDKIVSEADLKSIDMGLMLLYNKVYESQKGRKIH